MGGKQSSCVCSQDGVQRGAKGSPEKQHAQAEWSPNPRTEEFHTFRCSVCPFQEQGVLVLKT